MRAKKMRAGSAFLGCGLLCLGGVGNAFAGTSAEFATLLRSIPDENPNALEHRLSVGDCVLYRLGDNPVSDDVIARQNGSEVFVDLYSTPMDGSAVVVNGSAMPEFAEVARDEYENTLLTLDVTQLIRESGRGVAYYARQIVRAVVAPDGTLSSLHAVARKTTDGEWTTVSRVDCGR